MTFRPSAYIDIPITFDRGSGRSVSHKTVTRNRYSELKKLIPELTKESTNGTVRIYRSRRGEWGEWFEVWQDGKIVKEGWM